MKHVKFLCMAAAVAMLCGCAAFESVTTSASAAPAVARKSFPDNAFKEIPQAYFRECAKGGTVQKITYKTRNNQVAGSPDFEKYALVYLPNGYDEKDTGKRYDILYLMHGGSDNPEWYFGNDGKSRLKNVIDNMIDKGELKPLIICAVSYYTQYNNDATKNCIDFHYELDKDVIPFVESKFHTYAKNTTRKELDATRCHRAFSGFSMGACATWAAFEYCLNEIAYFLPMSGDCWAVGRGKSAESAKHLVDVVAKNGKTAKDFKIYGGCGENDIAKANMVPMIDEMKKYPETFIFCDNFAQGNLFQFVYANGGHDINTTMRVMYNGLPKMFD